MNKKLWIEVLVLLIAFVSVSIAVGIDFGEPELPKEKGLFLDQDINYFGETMHLSKAEFLPEINLYVITINGFSAMPSVSGTLTFVEERIDNNVRRDYYDLNYSFIELAGRIEESIFAMCVNRGECEDRLQAPLVPTINEVTSISVVPDTNEILIEMDGTVIVGELVMASKSYDTNKTPQEILSEIPLTHYNPDGSIDYNSYGEAHIVKAGRDTVDLLVYSGMQDARINAIKQLLCDKGILKKEDGCD